MPCELQFSIPFNCNFRFHSIAIFDFIHESMRRGVPGKGSPSPLWQLTLLGAGTPLPWRPSPGWGASWQETLARRRSSVSAIWGKDWPFFWWGKMWLCVLGLPPSPRWWSLISNYIQRFQTQTLCVKSLSNSRNIYSIMWWNVYFNCNAGFLICIQVINVKVNYNCAPEEPNNYNNNDSIQTCGVLHCFFLPFLSFLFGVSNSPWVFRFLKKSGLQ